MKLAVVVQRYGADINGGAELHARYVAERLSRHAEVEVVTTCAQDYVTWRNELPAGVEQVNGVPVRRFPVRTNAIPHAIRPAVAPRLRARRTRSPTNSRGSRAKARQARRCVDYLERRRRRPRFRACSSATATTTPGTARRRVPAKAVLVPTAERDPAIGLSIFGPMFRGVRAVMYNSPKSGR